MRNLIAGFGAGKSGTIVQPEDSKSMERAELMHRVELLASFEQAGLGWFWVTDGQTASAIFRRVLRCGLVIHLLNFGCAAD